MREGSKQRQEIPRDAGRRDCCRYGVKRRNRRTGTNGGVVEGGGSKQRQEIREEAE